MTLSLLMALALPSAAFGRHRPTYHHASHVKLTYCDWHACKDEKPRLIGVASFYGKHYWQGRRMANGKRFDCHKPTIATWGIPLGTMVRVTNLENGKSIVVEVTDRGPAHALHRVADLSEAAAEELGYIHQGTTEVFIEPLGMEPEMAEIGSQLEGRPLRGYRGRILSPPSAKLQLQQPMHIKRSWAM